MAKKMPEFQSEAEEKEFWKTHDVRDYINWKNAKPFINRIFKDKKNSDAILKDLLKK